jgi:hypothetical protein
VLTDKVQSMERGNRFLRRRNRNRHFVFLWVSAGVSRSRIRYSIAG